MQDDRQDQEESRKRKLEDIGDDEVRTPRGGPGIGRLQSGGNAMRDKVSLVSIFGG